MQGFFTKKFNEESIKKPPRTDMFLVICQGHIRERVVFYVFNILILNFSISLI